MSNLGVPVVQPVYTGVWTDWSHGKIIGSTLTVTQRNGSFLVAFIAMFVAFTGTAFFRITAYVIHVSFSKEVQMDAVYHQRQAILRNSANSTNAVWSFSQILWYWRQKGAHSFRKVVPYLVHSALCAIAFATAGVFSSRIAGLSGDEVLISSRGCGVHFVPDTASFEESIEVYTAYMAQRAGASLNYAQDCYSSNGTVNQHMCSNYVWGRLPYVVERNASCPFREDICRTPNENLRLDTGLLDSHQDLGLNAPPSRRIKLRQVLHCAPLAIENYADTFEYSNGTFSAPYRRYFYGPARGGANDTAVENFTRLEQQVTSKQIRFENRLSEDTTYGMGVSSDYMVREAGGSFFPNEALAHNDSDLHIMFLSAKDMLYSGPVDDFWFAAHEVVGTLHLPSKEQKVYKSDEAGSPLGCAAQYQVCLPGSSTKGQCTSLRGQIFPDYETFPDPSSEMFNTTQWMLFAINFRDGGPNAVVSSLGGTFLQARYTVNLGMQQPLLSNQWQNEMMRLFDITLAGMQIAVVDTATGPSDEAMRKFYQSPDNDDGKYACRNQKIRSTAYANFSVFGLAFTFALGSLIIVLHWTIECIHEQWVTRRRRRSQYARIEWKLNSTLQLQRLAQEGIGFGTWTHCSGDVPLPDANDKLAMIDLEDMNHPKLVTCPVEATPAPTEITAEKGPSGTTSMRPSQMDVMEVHEEQITRPESVEDGGATHTNSPLSEHYEEKSDSSAEHMQVIPEQELRDSLNAGGRTVEGSARSI